MESISHCCGYVETNNSGVTETKVKKRKIYDTTIEKARELASLYKDFNLTNNKQLSEASAKLEQVLSGVNAEVIRDSEAVRSIVKDGVDDILSKFKL